MTTTTTEAAAVTVRRYGELPGDQHRRKPGSAPMLSVSVGGQFAGLVGPDADCWLAASHLTALATPTITRHADADGAVAVVVASGFARALGARRASVITWTAKARRLAGAR